MTNKTEHIDQQMVLRLKGGDMVAFQKIFVFYSETLFHFTCSYLKNTGEAEEIVQDVFLRIWEKRAEIDLEKSFKSFLYTMTVNKVLNHLKHQVVRQKYEKYLNNFNHDFSESPEAQVHYKELGERIEGLMNKLPEQQRNIFSLSRQEGLSNSEISEKLGLSIRTVENQIYRAGKFLKEQLKGEYLFALLLLAHLL
ncbi:RNA polymerase sigma factor [Mangrovibacterium lignilyticum]|uniref:RNA polymerase sigma factor n=1 Tax=Mangrovibacterium lignilyticum TaxID=2668052 RepID=UPI0013CFD7D5|nr:RNA polymerase sigma-70 factor [Mangrovibacterium lignilyticum]